MSVDKNAHEADRFYVPTRYPNGLQDLIPAEAYGAPDAVRAIAAARDGLEDLPTLHRFDLVDFSTVSPEFRSAAMVHVIPLVGVMR